MQCLTKFPVAKKFRDKRGGVSRYSVEKPFSQSSKNVAGESFTVSLISGFSTNVRDKRNGEASRFSAEIFLSHSAEYFVGQPFCAVFQKFSVSEKGYG